MIPRYLFVILLFCCLPLLSRAQQQEFTVNGIVFVKNTSDRIAQATATNTRTQVIMMTDELGNFNIKAAKGDTLLFNKKGYGQQTLVINRSEDVVIYMQGIVVLPQVTINGGQSTKQQQNDVIDAYRSKGLYFDGKPPWWIFNPINGSPLTGLYELFSRDAKNERHFIKISKEESEAIEVNRRYTPKLVKQVTALPDTDVVKFMQQYTPSYEDLKTWNDYDLIKHIKRYQEYYAKHKEGIKSEQLY